MCLVGFNMMEAFGLTQRAHATVEGVSVEPFIFSTLPSYTIYRDVQLTQSTGWRLTTFPKCKSIQSMTAFWKSLSCFWLLLQLYPSSRLFSRAHYKHGLPPTPRLAQGALCSLAANWQRFPAQNGGGARPWVQGCMKQYRCMFQKWSKFRSKLAINENDPFSAVLSYWNITWTECCNHT